MKDANCSWIWSPFNTNSAKANIMFNTAKTTNFQTFTYKMILYPLSWCAKIDFLMIYSQTSVFICAHFTTINGMNQGDAPFLLFLPHVKAAREQQVHWLNELHLFFSTVYQRLVTYRDISFMRQLFFIFWHTQWKKYWFCIRSCGDSTKTKG